MESSQKTISIIIAICLAAYLGFAYGKHKRQQELNLQLELLNYSTWATDIEVKLDILQMLSEQKNSDAKNKLEAYLDVRLASLGNYEQIAKKYPDPQIFKAIKRAKKYRQQTSGHSVHPKLFSGVEQAFNIVE